MDKLTPEQRHKNMSNIKAKDTKIECVLRKALWQKGYRYRKNYKQLPGKPDIVLTKYRIAIFCDSEFFHGKDFDVLKEQLQKSKNSEFWINKIQKNIDRDIDVEKALKGLGWTVIRFWGKDIKKNTDECIRTIEECIFDMTIDGDSEMSRRPYCGEFIIQLLDEKGGKSTREELRPSLIENGYGSEAIRQAYLNLQRADKIRVEGSSHSQKQVIILNERNV